MNATLRRLVVTSCFAGAACAPAVHGARDPSLLVRSSDFEWSPPEGDALVADVAAMRRAGQPGDATRPITVRVLDDAAFEPLASTVIAVRARADPFSLAGPPPAAPWRGSFANRVLGLYTAGSDLVRVRKQPTVDGSVWTLVHEIAHALQDQSVPAALVGSASASDDERLARLALVEGDAEVSAAVYVAGGRRYLPGWLSHLLADLRDRPSPPDEPRDVPAYYRTVLSFPYLAGTVLAGQIYRAGGFSLLRAASTHPPASTAQVLDPEKYVRGERPAHVESPAAPGGFSIVDTGTMGALRTRALLDSCPATPRRAAALSWSGDAYTTASDGHGHTAVLWSTAWDDTASAEEFERAMRARRDCAPAEGDAVVVREGNRVAYVRGLSVEAAAPAAQALLAAPVGHVPPEPPLGDMQLPPLTDPMKFLRRGRIEAGWYVSDPLGLALPMAGYEAVRTPHEVELERYFGMTYVRVAVEVVLAPWTPDLERRVSWLQLDALREGGMAVSYDGERVVSTGAGPARVPSWSTTAGQLRIVPLAACGGKMTIVILLHDGGTGAWDEEARWLTRIRLRSDSEACRYVQASAP